MADRVGERRRKDVLQVQLGGCIARQRRVQRGGIRQAAHRARRPIGIEPDGGDTRGHRADRGGLLGVAHLQRLTTRLTTTSNNISIQQRDGTLDVSLLAHRHKRTALRLDQPDGLHRPHPRGEEARQVVLGHPVREVAHPEGPCRAQHRVGLYPLRRIGTGDGGPHQWRAARIRTPAPHHQQARLQLLLARIHKLLNVRADPTERAHRRIPRRLLR